MKERKIEPNCPRILFARRASDQITHCFFILLTIVALSVAPVLSTSSSPSNKGHQNTQWQQDSIVNDMPKASKVNHAIAMAEGDELIISGDGPGCWDDEDCNSYSTPADSGDDLITPQMVLLSTRKPYGAIDRGFQTSTVRTPGHRASYPNSGCRDDEDCFGGSGDGGRDEDDDEDEDRRKTTKIGIGSDIGGGSSSAKPAISYSWPGLKTPLPTPFYARPPVPTTPYEDKSIMFTSKPIPPSEEVISSLERHTVRPRPSAPPRPAGPRVIIDVPKPSMPHRERDKQTPPPPPISRHPQTTTSPISTFNKSSSANPQRTALVISVIALIIIVIVILAALIVIFRVRYRSASGPKSIDNRKNYQFDPVSSGVPPLLLNPNAAGSVTHLNVNPVSVAAGLNVDIKQSQGHPGLPGGPTLQQKNLKEWYV